MAATAMISTRYFGDASRASTVARAGVLAGSPQASQAAFMSPYIPHVGHVHGGGEDLRLVAADRRQRLVDLLENLLGLALRVRGRVGRHHAGQIHRVAVDDCLGEPRPDAVTLDAHALFLSAPEIGPERYPR